jgi:diguanylate cyclase (GGDEF)-like protein
MRDQAFRFASLSRRLLSAVLLFLLLDLSVLITNLWIANEVASNAIAINLAGRQRMLSQQITKDLLLLTQPDPFQPPAGTRKELEQALYLFQQTLGAFAEGSTATDTTLQPVELRAVDGEAALLVSRTRLLTQPLIQLLRTPDSTQSAAVLRPAARYMVEHNREILELMNRLTWRLEEDARRRTHTLQIVQICAFVLAIGNFAGIMLCMLRRMHNAERKGQEWQTAAHHDPLTGLLNRHGLDTKAKHLLDNHGSGALLLLDLDGFKPINDQYGHPTGDLVLKYVAQSLRSVARNTDLLARLGGDEFVLVCPQLEHPEAIHLLCGRLLDAIHRIQLPDQQRIHLRASVGVALYPRQARHLQELIHLADQAMYLSKRDGGQRWNLAFNTGPVANPTQG